MMHGRYAPKDYQRNLGTGGSSFLYMPPRARIDYTSKPSASRLFVSPGGVALVVGCGGIS